MERRPASHGGCVYYLVQSPGDLLSYAEHKFRQVSDKIEAAKVHDPRSGDYFRDNLFNIFVHTIDKYVSICNSFPFGIVDCTLAKDFDGTIVLIDYVPCSWGATEGLLLITATPVSRNNMRRLAPSGTSYLGSGSGNWYGILY